VAERITICLVTTSKFRTKGQKVSFRYYVYISDSKIDMLCQQIDPGLGRKRTSEVKLNVVGLGGQRRTEIPAGGERIVRLSRVIRHLEEYGDVGSIDVPGQYFRGLLPLQWGPFGEVESSLVYFGGHTERTILGLGGSGKHVLGWSGGEHQDRIAARSMLPWLLGGLSTDSDIDASLQGEHRDLDELDVVALKHVHQATTQLTGPAQTLEFIAKTLLRGPSPCPNVDPFEDMVVLLGSPLYVALVD
jgi:hypothetical protein